jgi:uncharacterized membrane protein YagU involved in acid resistance
MPDRKPLVAVFLGGGVAATLDLVYAILRNGGGGKPPLWTLQLVASGWLGAVSFENGWPAGILGVVSHYSTVFVAAALYFLISRRAPMLRSQAWLCGALFGVLVYLFMNFAVIPLSAFPYHLTYPPLRLLEGFASHAVFVGIPIALAIRWSASSQTTAR